MQKKSYSVSLELDIFSIRSFSRIPKTIRGTIQGNKDEK